MNSKVINNNFGYWTNGTFDQRKKIREEVCNKKKKKNVHEINGRSEK